MIVGGTSVGMGVALAGWGVGVVVAGGVTCKSSFWLGWRTEDAFNPFQLIRSLRTHFVEIRDPGQVFTAFDRMVILAVNGRS